MQSLKTFSGILFSALGFLGLALPVSTDQLPGYGQLSGAVTGSESGVLPVVYAYNTDKDVGYTVFVVDGKYHAVNLIPGNYDVTICPAVDQLEGFTAQTIKMDVAADTHDKADFALENVGAVPNYVGGYPYEVCSRENSDCGARIEPYETLFPPGRGRQIMENTCFGCHHVT